MTIQDFKNNHKTLSGIVVFYSAYCKVCEKQIELFEKVLKKFDKVECDDDPGYFIDSHGIDNLPETRIYENGSVVWKKIDFTSEEDLEFLRNYF